MKLVILAGGKGTRFVEETSSKPKPMIEVGGKPIIWLIMKYYSKFKINEFIICCGYKKEILKNFFLNNNYLSSDFSIDYRSNDVKINNKINENWKIHLVDTGDETNTAGRLKKVKKYVQNDEFFFFTYGDGLSNVNIKKQIQFHRNHKKLATVTAVKPPARFGAIILDKKKKYMVKNFKEKNDNNDLLINGGFFILSPKCIDFIKSFNSSWENDILPKIAKKKQLSAFIHKGFWRAMDSRRDKDQLEEIVKTGKIPWKNW